MAETRPGGPVPDQGSARLPEPREFRPDPKGAAGKKGASKPAGAMCEHRVRAPAHCKKCDEDKAERIAAARGQVGG